MTARRASLSAVGLTVLAVGVMLLMVMFAARSGPDRIFAGPLHDPSVRPVNPSISLPPRPLPTGFRRGDGSSSSLFHVIGVIIALAFFVCILWLLYLGVRAFMEYLAQRALRDKRSTGSEHVDFDVLDDPEPLLEEMRRDADEQFELLLGGSPRNAIVACWDRFEEQAERVSASRKHWETSSEFTLRLLEAVSADEGAVSRLETLYREARFSDHEIGESQRQDAVDALRRIHASLGIGAGAR